MIKRSNVDNIESNCGKTTLASRGDERTNCLPDENTADEHYADIEQSSVDYLRNNIQTRKIP